MAESVLKTARRSLTQKRAATTLVAGLLVIGLVFGLTTMTGAGDHIRKWAPQSGGYAGRPHHEVPAHGGSQGANPAHGDDHATAPPVDAPPAAAAPVADTYGYFDTTRDTGVPMEMKHGAELTEDDRERYESVEMWRQPDLMIERTHHNGPRRSPRPGRSHRRPRTDFKSQGDFLETQLVADYPPHPLINDVFLMMKTGSEVMWQRLPVHFLTTFTKVPTFEIYSDKPASMGGVEIIDIISPIPRKYIEDDGALNRYRATNQMHMEHWGWDAWDLAASGGWDIDKFKNIPMMAHAWEQDSTKKWYIFIDDDTFVFWENMMDYLSNFNHEDPYYMGSPATMFAHDMFIQFAHGGTGVVLSWGAMDRLFGSKRTKSVEEMIDLYSYESAVSCCGDATVALALKVEHDIELHQQWLGRYVFIGTRFQGNSIDTMIFVPELMQLPVLTWHHLNSRDVEVLWEYEKLRGHGANITYTDLYRDFVLPYIVEERPNWDLYTSDRDIYGGDENEYKDRDGNMILPWANKDQCRQSCEADESCFGWTWWPMECHWSTRGIKLGRAYNQFTKGKDKDDDHRRVSGWIIDRIREYRNRNPDDPLAKDPVTGKWNDDENSSEGWYVRQLQREAKAHETDPKKAAYLFFPDDSTIPGVGKLVNVGGGS